MSYFSDKSLERNKIVGWISQVPTLCYDWNHMGNTTTESLCDSELGALSFNPGTFILHKSFKLLTSLYLVVK